MVWHMISALLHSNGQLRTERDGDTEKGCKKNLLYSRRRLMMMTLKLGCVPVDFQRTYSNLCGSLVLGSKLC